MGVQCPGGHGCFGVACYFRELPPGRPPGPSEAAWVPHPEPRQTPLPYAPPLCFTGPPPQFEKAFPLVFVMVAVAQAKPDAFEQCMAYLLAIALFFFLCSCEYNNTNSHRRTTQFRFQDMQFHDTNGVIPPDAAAYVFISALVITLFLYTQNNCVRWNPPPWRPQVCSMGTPSPPVSGANSIFENTTPPPRNSYLCLLFFGGRHPKICERVKYCGAPAGHSKTNWLPAAHIFPIHYWFPFLTFGRCHDPPPGPYLRQHYQNHW